MSQEPAIPETTETAPDKAQITRNKYAAYEKQHKKGLSNRVKAAIAIVLLTAFIFGGWYLVNHLLKEASGEKEISTGFVMRGTLGANITGWGTAAPKEKADIGGKVIGTVTELYVQAGGVVQKGDMLFAVDPEDARTKLTAAVKTQNQILERVRLLNQDLENLNTYAPFNGHLVEATTLKPGEYVAAGTALGRLVDDSVMKLALYFSYGYLNEIRAEMPVTVSVPGSMTSLPGWVESVEKIRKVNADGTVCFRVNIEMNNPGTLSENMAATAYLIADSGERLLPYDTGSLKYLQEATLAAKTSGECLTSAINQYYDYAADTLLLSCSSNSLVKELEEENRTLTEQNKLVSEYYEQVQQTVQLSPINGMITGLVVEAGDKLTGSGTAVMTIADLSQMTIETNIDEVDISKVSVGMPVSVSFDQTEGPVYLEGKISTLSYVASSSGGKGSAAYFPATITLHNPGGLMPGMGVSYTISAVTHQDCLMVASSAIINTEFGPAVFVRAETAAQYTVLEIPSDSLPKGFVAVPVSIGLSDANNTEILEGISEGTEVYLEQSLTPGMNGVIIK